MLQYFQVFSSFNCRGTVEEPKKNPRRTALFLSPFERCKQVANRLKTCLLRLDQKEREAAAKRLKNENFAKNENIKKSIETREKHEKKHLLVNTGQI